MATYNIPTPPPIQLKISAPLTEDLTVNAPMGYTLEGMASGLLKAGHSIIITLNGTDYKVTGEDYTFPTGTASAASDVTYDNSTSGLTATNVQDAIDELNTDIQANKLALYLLY